MKGLPAVVKHLKIELKLYSNVNQTNKEKHNHSTSRRVQQSRPQEATPLRLQAFNVPRMNNPYQPMDDIRQIWSQPFTPSVPPWTFLWPPNNQLMPISY